MRNSFSKVTIQNSRIWNENFAIICKYFEQKNTFVQSIPRVPKTKVKEKPLTLCVSMALAHYFLVLLPGKKTCIIKMKNMASVTSTKSIQIYKGSLKTKSKSISMPKKIKGLKTT